MNKLPRNFSATVFDRTFNVFDPYSGRRKTIHRFLSVLPFIVVLVSLVFFIPFSLRIFESGLLLSVVLLIVCLNMMLIEVASETYQNARIFIDAFSNKANLGVGDLKVFQTLESVMPKFSNYYLGLSILFLTLAATLGYIWSLLLSFFARVISLILELSVSFGSAIGFEIALILFCLMVGVVQIFIWKIKNKFLSHLLSA